MNPKQSKKVNPLIDPLLSLAISLHSNPGIYALLLGSGVSSVAGIPTGWEITLDLIRKLASANGQNADPDPEKWYVNNFNEEPDYSKILEPIGGKTPAERNQILRSYFEPTIEEREEGLKVPTPAHHAIASLVSSGYIRMILTTNFDRLLEEALEAQGVVPTVLSTPDSLHGAIPYTHEKCTIVKLNGDYRDTRIKNTLKELAVYNKKVNEYLDRVLDDFGLIVCGWSAEWDVALRKAIKRCPNRRFTTYWTFRSDLKHEAKRITVHRKAEIIKIESADSFFQSLKEKVEALEDLSRPHPLSTKIAVATIKKYLVEEKYRIKLEDLVMDEVERVYSGFSDEAFPLGGDVNEDTVTRRLKDYEALTEILQAMLAAGSYYGSPNFCSILVRSFERIADPPGSRAGSVTWVNMKKYPSLLLFYSSGIAALAAGNYDILKSLFLKLQIRVDSKKFPAVLILYPNDIFYDAAKIIKTNSKTPASVYLNDVLKAPLRPYLPDDSTYENCFDRFEYLIALVSSDISEKFEGKLWMPIGCFGWRGESWRFINDDHPIKSFELEIKDMGDNWPPLKVGFFDGSLNRLKEIKLKLDEYVKQQNWR